jgi:Zn-dependent protease
VLPTQKGALRLFRFAGIQVYLHWSWFVVALVEFNIRREQYSSPFWNVAEYLALFLIVLLHEFGHALACRQTGGQADTIVLWPLGGVAYVAPPQRPGATLWSIAAGPLVNLILLPIALALALTADRLGWTDTLPNLRHFLLALAYINGGLLMFNLLPVYPLDGGQILRSLLWFVLGPARSLIVATVIGLIGAAAFGVIALSLGSIWLGLIAVFMFTNCWRSLQHARRLRRIENTSARAGIHCPACHAAPLVGPFWICHHCRTQFDTFATEGICPGCQQQFSVTNCPQCGASRPMSEWFQPSPPGI